MTDERITALEAEIAKLKSSQPTQIDRAAEGKWRDEMRQIAEQRASQGALSHYTRDQLREMVAACPDPQDLVRDHRGAPLGPSSEGAIPTSQTVSNVHSGAGLHGSNTSGWRRETPLTNPPGTNYADKLMDAQDRRDRHELIQREEAMRRARLKG
jgi:hypothetical protein